MIEYILALLLTAGIFYFAYNIGKRAGIKEEQLRVEKQKNEEWEKFLGIVRANGTADNQSLDSWLQERAEKSNTTVHTEL